VAGQGFDYERMMDRALRTVMRDALAQAAERGLPGEHHFYVTFRTDHPATRVPASLKQRFPGEMTIVLQYQFWGLEVDDAGFAVTLSFDAKHERLHIPFAAVTAFVDPSVQFGLQFQPIEVAQADPAAPAQPAASAAQPTAPPPSAVSDPAPAAGDDRIVKLDAFRKK
jgi:hypothetical protein